MSLKRRKTPIIKSDNYDNVDLSSANTPKEVPAMTPGNIKYISDGGDDSDDEDYVEDDDIGKTPVENAKTPSNTVDTIAAAPIAQ